MNKTNDEKNKIQIHIVSSVKGGCGKTAFSLFKAMDIAFEERGKDLESRNVPVIWIDADFKGTASKTLFYGENAEEFMVMHNGYAMEQLEEECLGLFETEPLSSKNILCFSREYIPYTINDYLKEELRGIQKMIIPGYVFGEVKSPSSRSGCINGMIDFIFSSGAISDKRLYNYGSGLPTIEIGRFTYLMKALLLRLFEKGKMQTRAVKQSEQSVDLHSNYKHIVIDMPPGDDAYSSALLSMIRQLAEEKQKEIEIHLYNLTTSDRGHMFTILESLQDTCERLRNYMHKEKIYAVLSEIRNGEFNSDDQYRDQINECQSQIQQELSDKGIEIEILKCEFQADYYNFCRSIDKKEFRYSIRGVYQ